MLTVLHKKLAKLSPVIFVCSSVNHESLAMLQCFVYVHAAVMCIVVFAFIFQNRTNPFAMVWVYPTNYISVLLDKGKGTAAHVYTNRLRLPATSAAHVYALARGHTAPEGECVYIYQAKHSCLCYN